jgi:transglutaminase-like putative cysteine protease
VPEVQHSPAARLEVLRLLRRKNRIAAAFVASVVCGATAASAASFSVGPAPRWVEERPLPTHSAVPHNDVSSGVYYLVSDEQIRVGEGPTERYSRTACKVLTSAGLEEVSEVSIGFDPTHERLQLHYARVLRNGRVVSSARAEKVKVVQQESELDRRIYNGSLNALVFLEDVRPGDIVDYAYTIVGDNPIFGGRFATSLDFGYGVPVADLHRRVVWPTARTLRYKAHGEAAEPTVTKAGDMTTYVWSKADAPAYADESDAPDWAEVYPWIQLSEYASWAEVADWARELFASQRRLTAPLRHLARGWEAEGRAEDRARRATRMVQDEVRYLGIEMGPSSYQPHPPDEVYARRFGDCKDKALLLSVLLDELRIDAAPALVSTELGTSIDDWLPTPFAFDHAIVQATIHDRTVWIDATQSGAGGRVMDTEPPPYRRALVLRPGTSALTTIPAAVLTEPTTIVDEVYRAQAPGATLDVTTTYRDADADSMRTSLAALSPAELARTRLDVRADGDSQVTAQHAPVVDDRRDENVLVIRESYHLPHFWTDGQMTLHAWRINNELERPSTTLRRLPLAVDHPVFVQQRITVDAGRSTSTADLPEHLDIKGPAFELERTSETSGEQIALTWEYRSLADAVAPNKVRDHLSALDRADSAVSHALSEHAAAVGPPSSPVAIGQAVLLLAWVTAIAVFITMRVHRRRAVESARPAAAAVRVVFGASPETALPAQSDDDMDARLQRIECACGRQGPLETLERARLVYDGAPMTVVTQHCERCGGKRDVYFRFPEPA